MVLSLDGHDRCPRGDHGGGTRTIKHAHGRTAVVTETTVVSVEEVGTQTVAVTLHTPPEFEAAPGQFVLLRIDVDGEEETAYYTLSSADAAETFEVTADTHPEGTVGPWLAAREPGDSVAVEGPFGDVRYTGGSDVAVLAEGPGIGPAVGIGERASDEGYDVTIVFWGADPPHQDRLDALEADGATVTLVDAREDLVAALTALDEEPRLFAFGFDEFVDTVKDALDDAGFGPDSAEIESFGPR